MTDRALPLAGRRVAVTRPEEDAAELASLLEAAGAIAVTAPFTEVVPPRDDVALRRALAQLEQYEWVVFTSARAVRAACAVRPAPWPRHRPLIAAVGDATAAEVLRLTERPADVVPAGMRGGDMVPEMLKRHFSASARVLWPRAQHPRPELPRDLAAAGALVDDPVAYRTLQRPEAASAVAALAAAGSIDVITLTAPSAVMCLARAVTAPLTCVIAVIGPSTAAAARECGMPVQVKAEAPMMSALVAALERFYLQEQGL